MYVSVYLPAPTSAVGAPAVAAADTPAAAALDDGKTGPCVDECLVQVRPLRPLVCQQRCRREGARAHQRQRRQRHLVGHLEPHRDLRGLYCTVSGLWNGKNTDRETHAKLHVN